MLAWSIRVSTSSTRGDQPPRCMVADTVNSTSAQVAKTADPTRGAVGREQDQQHTADEGERSGAGVQPAAHPGPDLGDHVGDLSGDVLAPGRGGGAEEGTKETYPVPGRAKQIPAAGPDPGTAVALGHVRRPGLRLPDGLRLVLAPRGRRRGPASR